MIPSALSGSGSMPYQRPLRPTFAPHRHGPACPSRLLRHRRVTGGRDEPGYDGCGMAARQLQRRLASLATRDLVGCTSKQGSRKHFTTENTENHGGPRSRKAWRAVQLHVGSVPSVIVLRFSSEQRPDRLSTKFPDIVQCGSALIDIGHTRLAGREVSSFIVSLALRDPQTFSVVKFYFLAGLSACRPVIATVDWQRAKAASGPAP